VKNIYVGNLKFDATEDQVRSMFEPYGQVDKVSIVTNRDTGQPRGFAFVEMADDAAAAQAMEALNGMSVGGRSLTVNEARPREERPRRSGGGNFGRSGGGSDAPGGRSGGRDRW
jgi:RNA recognition motif-containing protein